MVRGFIHQVLIYDGGTNVYANYTKVYGTYHPIANTCFLLYTRRGLVNALGLLVVDIVLLLTMLIGLLRHAYKNSIDIWKLLYQQVRLK
jgi:hypothetical protein